MEVTVKRTVEHSDLKNSDEILEVEFEYLKLEDVYREELEALCDMVEKHGTKFEVFYSIFESTDETEFEDAYQGEYNSFEEFVKYRVMDICSPPPEQIEMYIDWGQMASDWEGDYYFEKGYVFAA